MANKGANTNGLALLAYLLSNPGARSSDVHVHPYRCAATFLIGDERSFALFVSVDSSRSQWFVTFKPVPHLDKKHTVFGCLVGGDEVLDALEKLPVKPGTERPAKLVRITDIVMFANLPYVLLGPVGLMSHQLPRSVRGIQEAARETPREKSSSGGRSQDRCQGSKERDG